VLKVVALSGGYVRDDTNASLTKERGVVASYKRALTEGLSAKQALTISTHHSTGRGRPIPA
jgi:fructose-bisphosphate aldolase, class I